MYQELIKSKIKIFCLWLWYNICCNFLSALSHQELAGEKLLNSKSSHCVYDKLLFLDQFGEYLLHLPLGISYFYKIHQLPNKTFSCFTLLIYMKCLQMSEILSHSIQVDLRNPLPPYWKLLNWFPQGHRKLDSSPASNPLGNTICSHSPTCRKLENYYHVSRKK